MTVTRAAVAAYLDEQYSSLAETVGQDSDVTIGYKPDIDNALRLLGTGESDLATATVVDGLRGALFAIAEYYALRRFLGHLSAKVNTETGETSYNFTTMRDSVEAMMKAAAKRVALLGYVVDGAKTAIFRVY